MIRKLIMFVLSIIYVYPAICQNNIRYEYWIDENYAHREIRNGLTEKQEFIIDVSKCDQGLHSLYYRTITDGKYDILTRRIFYVPEDENKKPVDQCEYWIDDNYASRIKCPISSEDQEFTLDLSAYGQGIHAFHYRTIDADGAYGILNQFLFYVPDANTSEDSRIIGYRYGFVTIQRICNAKGSM